MNVKFPAERMEGPLKTEKTGEGRSFKACVEK